MVESTYAAQRIPDSFPETLLEIEGTEGSILVHHGEKMTVTTQGLFVIENIASPLLPWTSWPWHSSQEAVLHTNRHMLEAFIEGRSADVSGEDNRKTDALVEVAYEAKLFNF